MDDHEKAKEVEIKSGFSPLETFARALFSIVPGSMTYALFNDHISKRLAEPAALAVMIISLFWPKLVGISQRVPRALTKAVEDSVIIAGIAFPFVYLYPTETWHITLKVAWAILRTKA